MERVKFGEGNKCHDVGVGGEEEGVRALGIDVDFDRPDFDEFAFLDSGKLLARDGCEPGRLLAVRDSDVRHEVVAVHHLRHSAQHVEVPFLFLSLTQGCIHILNDHFMRREQLLAPCSNTVKFVLINLFHSVAVTGESISLGFRVTNLSLYFRSNNIIC